mmetsp:Transcript_26844/g.62599  ORF Transcript_26844/g.62599 Transcript_26844/m.62599 type:complete len:298 (-) Transcript_26844:56-949(-)
MASAEMVKLHSPAAYVLTSSLLSTPSLSLSYFLNSVCCASKTACARIFDSICSLWLLHEEKASAVLLLHVCILCCNTAISGLSGVASALGSPIRGAMTPRLLPKANAMSKRLAKRKAAHASALRSESAPASSTDCASVLTSSSVASLASVTSSPTRSSKLAAAGSATPSNSCNSSRSLSACSFASLRFLSSSCLFSSCLRRTSRTCSARSFACCRLLLHSSCTASFMLPQFWSSCSSTAFSATSHSSTLSSLLARTFWRAVRMTPAARRSSFCISCCRLSSSILFFCSSCRFFAASS